MFWEVPLIRMAIKGKLWTTCKNRGEEQVVNRVLRDPQYQG